MFLKLARRAAGLLFCFCVFSGASEAFDGLDLPLTLKRGEYRHFKVNENLKKNLASNRFLEMDILNQGGEEATFFLVLEDAESSGYWSRLNFKTTLVPGVNKAVFDLKRKVGERGSSKSGRRLDFKKLQKVFVSLDPDKKSSLRKVRIKDIRLLEPPPLDLPKGAFFFDFAGTDMPAADFADATVVTEKTAYKKDKGHGFAMLDLWQARDARFAPDALSSALSVNKAVFQIDLPAGKYRYELVWDELGYWEPPFWRDRFFTVNGKPALKESRFTARDYLRDILSFREEPENGTSAAEFYLDKAFAPVQGEFVSNGKAFFAFEGDPTGASLNTLFIWPEEKEGEAAKFREELGKSYRLEFERRYRNVETSGKRAGKHKTLNASFFSSSQEHKPNGECGKQKKAKLVSAIDGLAYFEICVNADPREPLTFEIQNFSGPGGKLSGARLDFGAYRFRPMSIDLNHETFSLKTQDMELIRHPSIELNGYATRYLNLSLGKEKKNLAPGSYRGEVVFKQGGAKDTLRFEILILDHSYGPLPFKAGFIGLNPFSAPYFEAKDKEELERTFRDNALRALSAGGFNLFTGLPSPKLTYRGPEKKSFSLNTQALDEFLENVQSNEVFMYNESFPANFSTGHQRNAGQSEKSFWENIEKGLGKIWSKHKQKDFVWLYSDEATGYRDAVAEDTQKFKRYKEIFPGLKLGGFGNLETWEKGKDLYQKWDYGLYSDIPSRASLNKLKKNGQKTGVYNLCAEREAALEFCFGPLLYMMKNAGIERYFEWHAAAIHNYPGFDLDGREADIALFLPGSAGEIVLTRRYFRAVRGLEISRKLFLLERYLNSRQAPGLKEIKAKKWLESIKRKNIFPLKRFVRTQAALFSKNESFEKTLDGFLLAFF